MPSSRFLIAGTAFVLIAPAALRAQTAAEAPAAAAAEPDSGEEDIIVTAGQRPRGAVLGDTTPEYSIGPADIRSFGVSTLAELLNELAPQTGSGQGRGGEAAVVLLNGKRISSFSEIRDIPTEAIVRTEIFPEELALKYGYKADQKVVNIVLRRRFRAVTTEASGTGATAGGQYSGAADASILRIDDAGRWNLAAKYQHDSPLYESERDIDRDVGLSGIDDRAYRTLLARSDQYSINGTLNRTVFNDIAATFNASFEGADTRGGLGAAIPAGGTTPLALLRDTTTRSGHVGASFGGAIAPWQWLLTGTYDISTITSETDRSLSIHDRARSTSQIGEAKLTANGPLFTLPAGKATASFAASFDAQGFDSRSRRNGTVTDGDLSRTIGTGQASIDLPIASRKENVLQPLGNLSANFNIAVDRLSDFGTLTTYGYGLNWSPLAPLNIITSVTNERGAPTAQQLGNPLETTPNVRAFDFVRQQTVAITSITGGNPDLRADDRTVFKLGMTLQPLAKIDLRLTANYTRSRIRDTIASLSAPTAALQAAFPDRFVRDGNGDLISIDTRPVNFAKESRDEIRWGINFSQRIGPAPSPDALAAFRRAQSGAPPLREGAAGTAAANNAGGPGGGAQGGGARGGFGGFGGPGGNQGRLSFSLYHSWYLKDEILIRDGLPSIDLLHGGAIGNSGGQPQHEITAQGNLSKNGLGLRLTAKWQSATHVDGATGSAAGRLNFDDRTTVGLRVFANLGQQRSLVEAHPWLRGSRISLIVDNLFDSKQRVHDATGGTPFSYQSDFLDPLGRSIKISFRKQFLPPRPTPPAFTTPPGGSPAPSPG